LLACLLACFNMLELSRKGTIRREHRQMFPCHSILVRLQPHRLSQTSPLFGLFFIRAMAPKGVQRAIMKRPSGCGSSSPGPAPTVPVGINWGASQFVLIRSNFDVGSYVFWSINTRRQVIVFDVNGVLDSLAPSMPVRPDQVREIFFLELEGVHESMVDWSDSGLRLARFVGYYPVTSLPAGLRS